MKLKIIIIFFTFFSIIANSQTKSGTVDSNYIISLMPESKIVLEKNQAYGAQLDSTFTVKLTEYQEKLDSFRKDEKNLGELTKKTMITELQGLEADLNSYRENATKLMEYNENDLMRPLYRKLTKAVEEIAKEKGYTQILTITGNQFAYADPKFDITDLVLQKLEIKVPEATTNK